MREGEPRFEEELPKKSLDAKEPKFEKETQPEGEQKKEAEQSVSYLESKKGEFSKEWKKLINENDSADVKRKKEQDFSSFLGCVDGKGRLLPKNPEEIDSQFQAYKEIMEYVYNLPPEFQASNMKHTDRNMTAEQRKEIQNAKEWQKDVLWDKYATEEGEGLPTRTFERNLPKLIESSKDAETLKMYAEIFKDCLGKTEPKLAVRYLDIAMQYGRRYGLTNDAVNGFTNKLLPALEKDDPQVAALKEAHFFGSAEGSKGIGDFTCESYVSEVNPKNINSLLMTLREVPTSDSAKFEQNRKDALAVGEPLRSFIHDQHPMVNEVIRVVLRYYDSHDKSELQPLVSKLTTLTGSGEDAIYKLSQYDEAGISEYTDEKEKKIDILRRLEKNTEKINESTEPPETSDSELNKVMKELAEEKDFVPKDLLQKAMDTVNSKLETMADQKEVGIEPNMVLAIAWLERKGYRAVRDMTYEDQLSAYKKPWFHSALKFQELTASAHPFDEKEFNDFTKKLDDSKTLKEAYRLVMDRTLKNVSELADVYMKNSKSNVTGALWSGNLAHELTALTDLKPADSIMGKKHRKEQEKPLEYKNTGD